MTTPDESSPRRVLVTGVSGALGGMVVRALEQRDDIVEIIGIDVEEPREPLQRTEFVRADLRNPLVARVVQASNVDTIIHMATVTGPRSAGGRSQMKERNVLGAMQLFGAAQKAEQVERVIVKSSTAVYGSGYDDPALFGEEDLPEDRPTRGWAGDAVEVEGYARQLGRRRPDVDVTLLRFANFLGAEVQSAFAAFFALPVVPSIFGYDPRLQFCHEEDAVEVLVRAATERHPGVYNVAGDGVVYLSQCVRLAGRLPVALPGALARAVGGVLGRSGRVDVTGEALQFLHHGRAVDTTALRAEFGFTPRYGSRATFEDFARRRRITGLVDRDEVVRWEKDLYDFIARRGQERFVATRRGGDRS
jgi:UDP-glucose 4-epimerase